MRDPLVKLACRFGIGHKPRSVLIVPIKLRPVFDRVGPTFSPIEVACILFLVLDQVRKNHLRDLADHATFDLVALPLCEDDVLLLFQ